jgi:hypothetical protein
VGTMMFGTREEVDCIQNVSFKGHDGEALCLAHKTSMVFFVGGLYAQDDGYVLRPQGVSGRYYTLSAAEVKELQGTGDLPTPLPAYHISALQYLLGYSLWIAIAVALVLGVWSKRRTGKRLARLAQEKPSEGPPLLHTETDRWLDGQVRVLLAPGERIQHQAYATDRELVGFGAALAKGMYVVLTDRRLIFIATRVGAFKPLQENQGVESVTRADLAQVVYDGARTLRLLLGDGTQRTIFVVATRTLSNQQAFLDDVPRLLAPVPVSVVAA